MNNTYVAHDCVLGHGVTIASSAVMGGNVQVGDGANLGLGVQVHQRRTIGPVAMVGMGSVVTRDVPPYAKAFGNPVRVRGVNAVGLRRLGFDDAVVTELIRLYESASVTPRRYEPSSLPAALAPLEGAFRWYAEASTGVRNDGRIRDRRYSSPALDGRMRSTTRIEGTMTVDSQAASGSPVDVAIEHLPRADACWSPCGFWSFSASSPGSPTPPSRPGPR